MADKKVSDMEEITEINDEDTNMVYVINNGNSRKMSLDTIRSSMVQQQQGMWILDWGSMQTWTISYGKTWTTTPQVLTLFLFSCVDTYPTSIKIGDKEVVSFPSGVDSEKRQCVWDYLYNNGILVRANQTLEITTRTTPNRIIAVFGIPYVNMSDPS